MKNKILITLWLSVLILIGAGLALHYLGVFNSLEPTSPQVNLATNLTSKEQASEKTPASTVKQASIITKIDYSASELASMYEASRLHNTCQQEITNKDNRQKVIRQRFDTALTKINDEKQWALAVMHMHELGVINAQEALSQINLYQLRSTRKNYEHHNRGLAPTAVQKAMMKNVEEISLALSNGDLGLLSQSTSRFKKQFDKRGLLTRVRKEEMLLSVDTMVGHAIASKMSTNIDAILEIVPASHEMLNQAIRSGADTAIVSRLLASMDFTNAPVYTIERERQTPIQTAIQFNNIDVLQLLLEQNKKRNLQFTFSPVNTIVMQVLKSKNELAFSSEQIEILTLLGNFDHSAHLWLNDELKKPELLGYPLAIIPDELRQKMKALSIKAQVFPKLKSTAPNDLDAETRAYFDDTAQRLQQSKSEYADKKRICEPVELAWKKQLPGLNVVVDIKPFLKPGLSFEAQVTYLARTSPTLVDFYYEQSLKSHADTAYIEDAVDKISDIRDDYPELAKAISSIEMDLFQRQFLVEKLCEEFDIEGVYASFPLARFIDYNNTTVGSCLFELADFYGELKREFFVHLDTFPSEIVHELNNYSVEQALNILNELSSSDSKYTAGFPKGRDALMLALDMKNSHGYQHDYRALLAGLLSRTELTTAHLRRLHRLKVVDILLFEDLASQFPSIKEASLQPFNIF